MDKSVVESRIRPRRSVCPKTLLGNRENRPGAAAQAGVVSWRALYPFQPKYIDRGDGIKMHYVDEGKGGPVVFVHGNPWWSFCFRDLMGAVKERRRVVAFDHVGMGLSEKPGEDRYEFTLQNRVADMSKLMDSLALEKITLVVHDWGGMIGCAWACLNPERVSRLVVFNTAAWIPEKYSFPWQLRLARSSLGELCVRGLNLFTIGGVATCFKRRKPAKDEVEGYYSPSKDADNRLAQHRFVRDIPREQGVPAYELCKWTGDNLSKLSGKPALIVWGGKDFVFTKPFYDEWVARFPAAEKRYLPDAGHLVFDDASAEVVPLVRKFIEA